MKVVDGFFRGGGGDDAKKVNKSLSGTADGKAPTKIWLMEEIPMNHLGCIVPYGKKLPTSTGDRRISEASTVSHQMT